MRIAMVSDRASTHVHNLSAALAGREHEVTVYMRRDGPGRPAETTLDGYRVVAVPAGPARPLPDTDLLSHMEEFAGLVRERWASAPPDVGHAHRWLPGLAATSAGQATGVPVVQTFHTLAGIEQRRSGAGPAAPAARAGVERTVANDARWIAAACTDELREVVRMGVPRTRISVVSGGVDLDRFVPEGPRQPRDKYPHRLVAAGTLLPPKGFATAIAALRALPDTELVIAGGPDKRELGTNEHARFLRSFAGSMSVGDQVRLAGHVPHEQMPALLRSADAVVCTPWYDPFGTVALEAMASGVPVVAAAAGGLADIVVDGVTGLLVPPRKPRELAGALRGLLGRRALREQYGAAGRDRAWARFGWDRVAGELARVYELATADQLART
ncbi:MAG TPA: glycosyltransferase [Actinophytocola sp.]|jgi:glycosyltransferase involved in cell wall biosynthesis|nr:glycosyltransferase [Actinophytocola sp.]